MSMSEWAKKEVEIACKRENPDRKEGEFDYGCACYESALKAFNSLMEDGHTGFSIGLTKQILNRLIDGTPLTPIEDTDDIWGYRQEDDGIKHYQCKRMSSLFKKVYPDGTIRYTDNNYAVQVNINDGGMWYNGFISDMVYDLFPITMPYIPSDEPYKVYCEDCLSNPENGDFDTMAVHYILKPDGERIDVDRFFKCDEEDTNWVEISKEEFMKRKEMDSMKDDKNESGSYKL